MSGKILNPATGRYVNASGRIGQALLKTGQPKTRQNNVVDLPKSVKTITPLSKQSKQSKQALDPDQIKRMLESHPKVKLAIDQELKTMFPFQFNSPNYTKYTASISGHYLARIYFAFVFTHTRQVHLLVKEDDIHVVVKDLQLDTTTANSATIFEPTRQNFKEVEDLVNTLLKPVFDVNIKIGHVDTFKYMVPKTYKRLEEQHNYIQPRTPPTIARDSEGIPNDPCFMRDEASNRIYVFHTNKDLGSMKGYKPVAITVVERTKPANSKRFKYTNKLIITYPSWATYADTDAIKLSEYMQEIFNIINSIPWLAKFRGLSPYPKTIVKCKVGTYQTQFQQCRAASP